MGWISAGAGVSNADTLPVGAHFFAGVAQIFAGVDIQPGEKYFREKNIAAR